MRGRDTLWQPGTDHAGIATQMVVERQLNAAGQDAAPTSAREAFVERVWHWKAQSGGTISAQMRRLGDSVDWSRDRFTMDPGPVARGDRGVRAAARGRPHLPRQAPGQLGPGAAHGALGPRGADARRRTAQLWHLRYPLADGSRSRRGRHHAARDACSGTPRSRCNPDDERYRAADRPARAAAARRHRVIPIIADDYVDPAFGSGCVKITPGARLQRLRDRPAARPAADQHLHPARRAQRRRARALSRARPLRGAPARRGGARSRRAPRARSRSTSSRCRAATAAAPCSSPTSPTSGT